MEMYALIRDDLESINELSLWPGMKDPMDRVDTKTKSAFTRLVNKAILPYSITKPVKAKGRAKADELEGMDGDVGDEELEQEEEKEDESLGKNAMIKMKSRKTSSATSGRWKGKKGDDLDEARPSTSKASKGKGSRSKK